MLYQDKSQEDFLPNTQYLTGNLINVVYYDWKTTAGFGVDIVGAIPNGQYLLIQGTSDGQTWTQLFTVSDGTQVTNNQIVTTPGHYTVNTVGYQQGRIIPSDTWTGNVKLTSNITVLPPPEVAVVLGGGE